MCPPLPGQVPVEPTDISNVPTAHGAVEASPGSTGEIEIRQNDEYTQFLSNFFLKYFSWTKRS